MKRILLCLACALTVLLSACSPASVLLENPEKTERPRVERTEAPTVNEADERDAIVTKFLVGLFKNQKDTVAECVPSELRDYMWKTMEDPDSIAETVEITLIGGNGGVECVGEYEESLNYVKDEYAHEVGVILDIEEAYAYGFSYTATWTNGTTSTDEGYNFGMLAVKIDGVWYAIPAGL